MTLGQAIKTVYIKLTTKVDTSGLKKADKAVQKTTKELGKAGKNAGILNNKLKGVAKGFIAAFAAGKIVRGIQDTVAQGNEIAKNAKAADLTAEAYQRLAFQLGIVGVETKVFLNSADEFSRKLGEGARGSKSVTEALARANLTLSDFNGLTKTDALDLLLSKVRDLDEATRKDILGQLAGEGFKGLDKYFAATKAELAKAVVEFDKIGPAFTNKQAALSEALTDEGDKVGLAIEKLKTKLVFSITPERIDEVTEAIDNLTAAINWFGDQAKENLGPLGDIVDIFVWFGGVLDDLKERFPILEKLAGLMPILGGNPLTAINKKILGGVKSIIGIDDDSGSSEQGGSLSALTTPQPAAAYRGSTITSYSNDTNSWTVYVDASGQNPAQTADQIQKMGKRNNRQAKAPN